MARNAYVPLIRPPPGKRFTAGGPPPAPGATASPRRSARGGSGRAHFCKAPGGAYLWLPPGGALQPGLPPSPAPPPLRCPPPLRGGVRLRIRPRRRGAPRRPRAARGPAPSTGCGRTPSRRRARPRRAGWCGRARTRWRRAPSPPARRCRRTPPCSPAWARPSTASPGRGPRGAPGGWGGPPRRPGGLGGAGRRGVLRQGQVPPPGGRGRPGLLGHGPARRGGAPCPPDGGGREALPLYRGPELLFVHLSDPDIAGHTVGWMSAPYRAAVRRADAALGRVLRPRRPATATTLSCSSPPTMAAMPAPTAATTPWTGPSPGSPGQRDRPRPHRRPGDHLRHRRDGALAPGRPCPDSWDGRPVTGAFAFGEVRAETRRTGGEVGRNGGGAKVNDDGGPHPARLRLATLVCLGEVNLRSQAERQVVLPGCSDTEGELLGAGSVWRSKARTVALSATSNRRQG